MTREDFIDQMVKEYSDKYVIYVGSREEIEKINMRALCEIIYNSQFFIDKGIEKLIQENKMKGGIGYENKICDMY